MGIISEVMACFCRKRVFGYTAVAFSSVAIAVFSFFVWAHHMFIMGISNYSALVFSLMSMLVAVPSAIKVFNWRDHVQGLDPLRYPDDVCAWASLAFHYWWDDRSLSGVSRHGYSSDRNVLHRRSLPLRHGRGDGERHMAGLHFWWPKITGRMYPESMGKLAAVILFIGFNLTFFPQFILGYLGMPRRYHAYPPEFQVLNVLSSAGASILAIGYLLPHSLPGLVAQVRKDRGIQSMAGGWAGMVRFVTATDRELR